ncbi:hypothetical protein [Yinghuangia sp. YIM S09857]|uniref:hypothetical protein n=1 Tax=Yinghuangia sp. YIM S09857 TaxID=3436929 RepID=UPI003F52CFA2
MNTGIARRAVWAGTIAAFLLVAGFGNQWLWEEIFEHRDAGPNSGWQILDWLATPLWIVDTGGIFEGIDDDRVIGGLLGAVGLIVTVGLVIGAAARRDGFPAFLTGWFSLVAGGAVYTFVNYLVSGGGPGTTSFAGDGDDRTLAGTLSMLAYGGGYGLLAGWFVGLACVFATAGGSLGYGSSFPSVQPPPPSDRRY